MFRITMLTSRCTEKFDVNIITMIMERKRQIKFMLSCSPFHKQRKYNI